MSPFWINRLLSDDPPQIAVFVCGHYVHRRLIDAIYCCDPEELLNRELSEQGKQDISTDICICIELGYGQCERCHFWSDEIFLHRWKEDDPCSDYFGEWREMNTCWDCDFDIINGGDPDEDYCDLIDRREEEDYFNDPINNDPPWWMRRFL